MLVINKDESLLKTRDESILSLIHLNGLKNRSKVDLFINEFNW